VSFIIILSLKAIFDHLKNCGADHKIAKLSEAFLSSGGAQFGSDLISLGHDLIKKRLDRQNFGGKADTLSARQNAF
jgi:hypothetical protein